ncbi:N-acetyltransferase [Methylocystis rosea]|uniref:N-acetyltransferase n=2 Tax=Methylocystis rosea TaxID=173366 RepID=A0ABX6EFX3_9HYPH|nr:N-acetyltransferase [Methylocystis rosea]
MAFLAHHDFDAGPRASRRACSAMSHARLEARGPFTLAEETLADVAAREALLDDAFGPARFLKTCQRLRDGSAPATGLALVATDGVGALIGTLRLWPVVAGGRAALLLGPLAVAAQARSLGVGGALIRESLARAADFGHRAVLLVGDAPYYARFGFERRFTERLTMPGPVERARFLGVELVDGALSGARGRVVPATMPALDLPQAA